MRQTSTLSSQADLVNNVHHYTLSNQTSRDLSSHFYVGKTQIYNKFH